MPTELSDNMTATERRTALSLAAVYSVRMLGLFMILPVFALYAEDLAHVTPFLTGVAIGIYGFTQAALQIPLGLLSDRIGRKRVIVAGLLVFMAGSAVAGSSDSIYGVIAGRALQGMGAVASAVMALAADLTREEQRSKAMAVIGFSIGVAFSLALIAGPLLDRWIGVPGIFWLTALLGAVAIWIVLRWVPQPRAVRVHRDTEAVPAFLGTVLRDVQLLRLDLGIFTLHLVLTANFVALPLLLRDHIGIGPDHHWWIYLPVLLVSFFLMLPFIIIGERRRQMKAVLVGAVAVLVLGQLGLVWGGSGLWGLIAALVVFFTAFNLLEASLPSLVSKLAPAGKKGTALGAYSSSQFLGIFVGGGVGGALYGVWGVDGVFLMGALAGLAWLLAALTMRNPSYLSSYLLNIGRLDPEAARSMAAELRSVDGVADVAIVAEEGLAYLKVDRRSLDEGRLRELTAGQA